MAAASTWRETMKASASPECANASNRSTGGFRSKAPRTSAPSSPSNSPLANYFNSSPHHLPMPPAKAAPGKIRVLIADDHVTVLEGLASIIGRQKDMTVVAQAAD